MESEQERRLYGPNLALIGRGLEVHHMHCHAEDDATQSPLFREGPGIGIERCSYSVHEGVGLGSGSSHGLGEEGARPPELLYREVGGTHVFVGHSALAIVRGNQVWAVTASGVEALA